MELEEIIRRYPDAMNQHNIALGDITKLASLLNPNISRGIIHQLPRLAPFLVSSLLVAEEVGVATAIENVNTCLPHVHEQLQKVVLDSLSQIQGVLKTSLEQPERATRALQVWKTIIEILGAVLHKNRVAVNTLLIIPEKAFKSAHPSTQKNAFIVWKELIDNFAENPDIISNAKRLKLVLQPMLSSKVKTEDVLVARCDTWWHLATKLGSKLIPECDKVCIPLLKTVFQIPSLTAGRITNVPNSDGEVLKSLQLRASEMLIRVLEQPNISSPAGLTSPKKVPDISIPQLTITIPNKNIAQHSELFLELSKKALRFLNGIQPASPLSQMLLQSLLLRMNALSKEQGKEEVQAVAQFIQFVRICVQEQLTPSGLRLIDDVTRLLPSKVLTSHCYHLAMNSMEVMNSVPALGFLEMLLSEVVISKAITINKYVVVFNRLVNVGVDETDFYLSFTLSVLERLKDLNSSEVSLNADILLSLWNHTASALWRKIQKTQDVNQGDNLEHDFSCLLAALVLPMRLQLTSPFSLRTKEVEKNWSQLCKAFLRCAALVNNTEANVACEELSSQMLSLLDGEAQKKHLVLSWISFTIGIIIDSIDFQSVNTLPNAASMLQSPERWRKRLQHPLGNLSGVTTLLCCTLQSLFSIISEDLGKMGPMDPFFADCLSHVKSIFGSATSSSLLLPLSNTFVPSLVPIFQKFKTGKTLGPNLKKLEQVWQTMVNCFVLHFKGPHSQESFDILGLYLEPTLLHSHKAIQERARNLWQAAFAEIYNTLSFPDSFKAVLKQVQPPLIPGAEISSAETVASFEQSSDELPKMIRTPKRRKSLGPELQAEANTFLRPERSSTGKIVKKDQQKKQTKEEFVKIPPQPKARKQVLTPRQKEVLKQKSHIPAMYNDLSQDTQLSQDSQSEDSTSIQIPSTAKAVPMEVEEEQTPIARKEQTPEDAPFIDLVSSGTSTSTNSVPAESTTLECSVSSQDSPPNNTVLYNSDYEALLSGNDSPVLLPSGVSSKDLKMPRAVKWDAKLNSQILSVKLQALPDKQHSKEKVKDSPKRKRKTNTGRATSGKKGGSKIASSSPSKIASSSPSKIASSSGSKIASSSPSKFAGSSPSKLAGSSPSKLAGSSPSKIASSSASAQPQPSSSELAGSSVSAQPQLSSSENLLTELGEKSVSPVVEAVLELRDKQPDVIATIEILDSQVVEESQVQVEDPNVSVASICEDQAPEAQEKMGSLCEPFEIPVSDSSVSDQSAVVVEVCPEVPVALQSTVIVDVIPKVPAALQSTVVVDVSPKVPVALHSTVDSAASEVYVIEETEPQVDIHDSEQGHANYSKIVNYSEKNVGGKLNVSIHLEECLKDLVDSVVDNDVQLMNKQNSELDGSMKTNELANIQEEPSQTITEFSSEEICVTQSSNPTRKRKATSQVRNSTKSKTEVILSRKRKHVVEDTNNKQLRKAGANKSNQGAVSLSEDEGAIENSASQEKGKENVLLEQVSSSELKMVPTPLESLTVVKQSPNSDNRKRIRVTTLSPLSRSHMMVQAARKSQSSCPNSPSSPRASATAVDESPPHKKSRRHIYSPLASPSSGILKVKTQVTESSSNGQKRRVSFADPPVQDEVDPMDPDTFKPLELPVISESIPQESFSENGTPLGSTLDILGESDLDVNSQGPIFPGLLDCSDSLHQILAQLTSSMWSRGLEKLLLAQKISTVGQLCALTAPKVLTLPIQAPKLKTLCSVLANYQQQHRGSHEFSKAATTTSMMELDKQQISSVSNGESSAIETVHITDSEMPTEILEEQTFTQDLPTTESQASNFVTQVPSVAIASNENDEESHGNMTQYYDAEESFEDVNADQNFMDTTVDPESVESQEVQTVPPPQETTVVPPSTQEDKELLWMETVLEDNSLLQTPALVHHLDPSATLTNDSKESHLTIPSLPCPKIVLCVANPDPECPPPKAAHSEPVFPLESKAEASDMVLKDLPIRLSSFMDKFDSMTNEELINTQKELSNTQNELLNTQKELMKVIERRFLNP